MKIYFPLHLNGGNRGCEAIAKGTAMILNEPKENLIGFCNNIALDNYLGISKYISLIDAPQKKTKLLLRKAHRLICPDHQKHLLFVYKQIYDPFLKTIPSDGIVFSTGGDIFCYGNNEAIYTSADCQKRSLRTVLWGCSIGEENLTPEKLKILKNFNLIYVRESLTEEILQNHGIRQTVCYPDPAFILSPEKVSLPEYFKTKEVIGINLSRFVIYPQSIKLGMIINFIDYILKKTDMQIMFVSHVLWFDQDDRKISKYFIEMYSQTGRVHLLDADCLNYCEIRHIISKCRYFIGARTHSVISAYSTCVPSIALGYSIKSKGIAKDLGLDEQLVVDCTNDCYDTKITDAFTYLQTNEIEIKQHLETVMPEYKQRLKGVKTDINRVLNP